MNLIVNGDRRDSFKEGLTVAELIRLDHIQDPEMVSVQLNGVFLEKADFTGAILKDNDEIDFLYFMGGGSR
jgi:sulfur carrier protein